jgi:16S rRNA (cytosine967-C5)-methyltransferase
MFTNTAISIKIAIALRDIKDSMNFPATSNPREAAYLALLASLRGDQFIEESLKLWFQQSSPSVSDYHLAERIACGAMQMSSSLDYLAIQLASQKKLSLKLKEKALLRLALYQFYFLDRIPLYAITDEAVKLARKYCHETFVRFLNATLRKLPDHPLKLPSENSVTGLAIHYSYSEFFAKELLYDYGLSQTKEILASGNVSAPVTIRLRNESDILPQHWLSALESIDSDYPRIALLKDLKLLPEITQSPHTYIQNITPAILIAKLAKQCSLPPKTILDLCASPGGKLIAAHDAFPHAQLFGNDVSPEKMKQLQENCSKYNLQATLSCGLGQEFNSTSKFDVIILDVPCSNSGVLNKRPEARWRLSATALDDLEKTQLSLIKHAASLLSPNGELWYLSCSILKRENEKLIKLACDLYHLKVHFQELTLPNQKGYDGGFACVMKKEGTKGTKGTQGT